MWSFPLHSGLCWSRQVRSLGNSGLGCWSSSRNWRVTAGYLSALNRTVLSLEAGSVSREKKMTASLLNASEDLMTWALFGIASPTSGKKASVSYFNSEHRKAISECLRSLSWMAISLEHGLVVKENTKTAFLLNESKDLMTQDLFGTPPPKRGKEVSVSCCISKS